MEGVWKRNDCLAEWLEPKQLVSLKVDDEKSKTRRYLYEKERNTNKDCTKSTYQSRRYELREIHTKAFLLWHDPKYIDRFMPSSERILHIET